MKKILDVTCGSRTIWFNKSHPAAVYCDKRQETHTNVWKNENGKAERECVIAPDVVCDFADLPFDDNAFSLVVFDPAPSSEGEGDSLAGEEVQQTGRKLAPYDTGRLPGVHESAEAGRRADIQVVRVRHPRQEGVGSDRPAPPVRAPQWQEIEDFLGLFYEGGWSDG